MPQSFGFGRWCKLLGLKPKTLTSSSASVFYGGALGDTEDREALVSLTQACLSPSSRNWAQPHTPQYLLATLMPSPGKLRSWMYVGAGEQCRAGQLPQECEQQYQ